VNENELSRVEFAFKEPEFRSFVPIEARYECAQCHRQFGDKYRFRMHTLWAHQSVVCSKKAQNEKWKLLNQFDCDKPLSFACPYAGCLRGSNDKNDIEAHILRHHDITDPTKQPVRKQKVKKIEKEIEEKKVEQDDAEYIQIAKIWNEATEKKIDRECERDLMRHFVSSVMGDNLEKFDETTKKLQIRYEQMEKAGNNKKTPGNDDDMSELPPMLGDEDDLQTVEGQDDGPRSMWN